MAVLGGLDGLVFIVCIGLNTGARVMSEFFNKAVVKILGVIGVNIA
ncbi:MAG: hypothetical protein WA635_01780 [Gallionella sp.]